MRYRCSNPNNTNYYNYGAQGITVDPAWNDFYTFVNDIGERPSNEHTIDRIDGTKGYSRDNCKWATKKEQSRNLCTNRMITWRGQTRCLSEWSEATLISAATISYRINAGWPLDEALNYWGRRPYELGGR
jgi:hypothetical protein